MTYLQESRDLGQRKPGVKTAGARFAFLGPRLFALVLLAAASQRACAQDGKLVDAVAVTLDEQVVQAMKVHTPDIQSVLERVDLKTITYLSDGLKVKGYLATPTQGDNLPCVIFNRGGNREFGALDDRDAAYFLARIASWGYVVVASQYRGNAGGEGKEEYGGRDVDDVLNLLPLLKSLPQADATRVGMVGWSRGGMMTYLALRKTDQIAAAVVASGAADASDFSLGQPGLERHVYAELIPDYARNKRAALAARSAVRWADQLNKSTPILLLHGAADWRVDLRQALAMASRLYEFKHPFRLIVFEGGNHSLTEHRAEVDRVIRDWLDRYVRDKQPWPNPVPHGE